MSRTTLSEEEIQSLRDAYPGEVLHYCYGLTVLEKHLGSLSDIYGERAEFSGLMEKMDDLLHMCDEGRGYLDRYLLSSGDDAPVPVTRRNADDDEPRSAKNRAIDITRLADFMQDLGESLDTDLSTRPNIATDFECESDEKYNQLDEELAAIWDEEVQETGYDLYHILIGASFGPEELRTSGSAANMSANEQRKSIALCTAEKSDAILKQLQSVAASDSREMDPNERCAAITLALAILTEPENVFVDSFSGLKIDYKSVSVRLTEKRSTGLLFSRIVINRTGTGERYSILKNLAETYADHVRDTQAWIHLKRYLPMAVTPLHTAAVLGIAWAILQRLEISTWVVVSSDSNDSGSWVTADSVGVTLQTDRDRIVSATYPGLHWLNAVSCGT